MKKRGMAALALCAVLALTLAGCGLFGAGKDVAGSWRTLRVEASDNACRNGRVNLELKTFGDASLQVVYGDGGETDGEAREGKWKLQGGDVVCSFEEEEVLLPIEGGEMIYSDARFTVYLERLEESSGDEEEEGAALRNFLRRLLDL